MLAGLLGPLSIEAGNIACNPGFEYTSSGNGDESVPDGWVVNPSNVSINVVSTNYTHSGNNAVKLSENNQSVSLLNTLKTNEYSTFADKMIVLSAWVLTPDNDPLTSTHGDLAIQFYTASGNLCNPGGWLCAATKESLTGSQAGRIPGMGAEH